MDNLFNLFWLFFIISSLQPIIRQKMLEAARVRLLRLLVERGGCVCGELVGELELAQSTVSQHLKVLKDAGIVESSRRGTLQ